MKGLDDQVAQDIIKRQFKIPAEFTVTKLHCAYHPQEAPLEVNEDVEWHPIALFLIDHINCDKNRKTPNGWID